MMFVSLAIIVAIGWSNNQTFEFISGQFWFIAGALLLILLSLVDQPFFSKDANVFINGATAWVSLFSLARDERTALWWIFLAWASYLIISSYTLMWIRSRELFLESKTVQLISRINRAIGRPESIFSAFLLWGIFLQFSYPKDGITINSLLVFWGVFMVLNVPSVALSVSSLFDQKKDDDIATGFVTAIRSPRIAEVRLSFRLRDNIVGKQFALRLESGDQLASGVLLQDRVVKGFRQGMLAITSYEARWSEIGANDRRVELTLSSTKPDGEPPVGVAAPDSTIGNLVFEVDPRRPLHAGQVVMAKAGEAESYYQIVAAKIAEGPLADGNLLQNVRVVAGQLGLWNTASATFDPIDWVPSAGEMVRISNGAVGALPAGRCKVGDVPNSQFPVHVDLADTVTHNTALIGVTGSGKSYLAFHLIESYLAAGIKVLILDLTRQHYQFLHKLNPTQLTKPEDVTTWLNSDSNFALHQFAAAKDGFPKTTSEYVEKCFEWLGNNVKLKAGVNAPAKLCVVMEEAHSLIPEWNQVAQKGDESYVNKTARVILQGRKYGLGSLLITQRTANVTKTILNQCNTIFALRSFDQTGLDFLRNYMGEEYSQAISTLPQHTAILVGKASSSARPIILKITDFKDRWTEVPAAAPVPKADIPPAAVHHEGQGIV